MSLTARVPELEIAAGEVLYQTVNRPGGSHMDADRDDGTEG